MPDYEVFEAGDFALLEGATLRDLRLAYKTYGTLNAEKTNAIVYPTWYSGQHPDNEWLIGDGMALDPSRYFVVIPNMLANGLSSSRSSSNSTSTRLGRSGVPTNCSRSCSPTRRPSRGGQVTLMTAEDVADLYSGLLARGVQLWVDGGWGIDALLGRQTRPHKDFDAMVAFEDLPALTRFLGERGFSLKLIWEENRWMPCPEPPALVGRERPAVEAATAFVLEDGSGREIDFHVVRFDEQGHGAPAWDTDLVFPPGALAGVGIVGGTRVRCLSAEVQMRTHTGYALKESDVHDLRLLHDRFSIDYPDEVADLFSAR